VGDSTIEAEHRAFIERRYGRQASELAPLNAGEWSRAYAFSLDGLEVVVRFGAYGEDFAKDEAMAAHGSSRLPIPRVLEIGEVPSGYYAVSVRAQGTPLDDLDEAGLRLVLAALLDALDAIRGIDTSAAEGFGIGHPMGLARVPRGRKRFSISPRIAQASGPTAGGAPSKDLRLGRLPSMQRSGSWNASSVHYPTSVTSSTVTCSTATSSSRVTTSPRYSTGETRSTATTSTMQRGPCTGGRGTQRGTRSTSARNYSRTGSVRAVPRGTPRIDSTAT
jgi:hypothetical protein